MKARIQYQAGTSFLHGLHPLVKLAWLIFLTVLLFVVFNIWLAGGVLAFTFLLYLLVGINPFKLRGIRLILLTAVLLLTLQIAFNNTGAAVYSTGLFTITTNGLSTGFIVAFRFIAVILLSYLFVLTTDPNDLAYTLIKAGLPYRYGFTLVTAIRLVPVFEQEGARVYQAQLARGVKYRTRSLRQLFINGRQFFMPLLVSAVGKVDKLAISMEGRSFGRYPQRSFLRVFKITPGDVLAAVVLIICFITVLAILL